MKTNLPVTGNEVPFPRGRYLVSRTDLKGAIVHANDAFVGLSGFTRGELIGQNHNVVRHPDMPPEAFADLWNTVQQGLPWHGLVKNRCKNGDYYWVRASVVPVRRDGVTTGYLSVRTEPGRDEVRRAESLYAAVLAGSARLPRHGAGLMARLSFATRLWGVLGAIVALVLSIGAVVRMRPDWAGGYATAASTAAACLVAGVGVYFTVRVGRPLERIGAVFRHIAEGNLTVDIDVGGRDETGLVLCHLDAMRVNLLAIIDDIATASRTIDAHCRDLDGRMGMVSEQSNLQHDSAKSIAAATEQLSVSVREVAHGAGQASGAARRAEDLANAGNGRLGETMAATVRVVDEVRRSSDTIGELSSAIGRIGTITSAIQEIAGQTNLLALNAAIEAARAGEQGRGFAVVADEVRKLAERTGESTRTISDTIARIQDVTARAVNEMTRARQEVEASLDTMRDSVATLEGVTRAGGEVTAMSQGIADATVEQTQASEEVARNMERITQLIEDNLNAAAASRQDAGALFATSANLNAMIGNFRIYRA